MEDGASSDGNIGTILEEEEEEEKEKKVMVVVVVMVMVMMEQTNEVDK